MTIQINGTTGISGVSGSAGTPALQGDDTNTGVFFGTDEVRIATNGTQRAVVDSSGRLLVGTSSARTAFFNTAATAPLLQVEGASSGTGQFSSVVYGESGNGGPYLVIGKHRGTTTGGVTLVNDGDQLGAVSFQGADGTEFVEGARIQAFVDGAPGANDLPSRLVFSTTADGASSPTERMRISQNGIVDSFTDFDFAIRSKTLSSSTSSAVLRILTGATNNTNGGAVCYVYADGDVENTNNRYTGFSDIRFKQNIEDSGSQWDDIKNVRVRKYELASDPSRRQIGVIAQELELTSPGLVIERGDANTGETHKSVAYSVLYMKAVKALQEAMERIEHLEGRLTAAGL